MDEPELHVDLGDKPLSASELLAKLCAQLGVPIEAALMIQAVLVMSGDPTTMIEAEAFAATITALGKRFGFRMVKVETPPVGVEEQLRWPDEL